MKTTIHFYISLLFLLRMRNFSDEYVEKINFVFSNLQNHAVYEIMWKNVVEPDRPQMTIWRMLIACWVPKAANTHALVCNTHAFPLQQDDNMAHAHCMLGT